MGIGDDRRETGPIPVSPRLGEMLIRLRAAEGVQAQPEVDVDAVRDVDRALGWRLPDDLIATFAARLPQLEVERELALAKVVGHTGRVRAMGAPGDLVGVGKDDTRVWLCVRKGEQPPEGTALFKYDADDGSTFRVPLVDYLEACLGEAGTAEPAAGAFEPVLVRRLPAGSPGQRVRHATFGEGKVLKETGSGPTRKVQVDFPGRGLKLLQARFLEYLD